MGKPHARQRLVARRAVGRFLRGPAGKLLALLLEEGLELRGLVMLAEGRFLLARHVEIDHAHVHASKAELLAQQPGVNPGLGQVQVSMVLRQRRPVPAHRLDLFQQVPGGVVAIGTPAHP